ncbi:MAG: hypothetical protein IPG64_19580 [Haliea sp.]|nr:hypothetical protein [Haliea sp.]
MQRPSNNERNPYVDQLLHQIFLPLLAALVLPVVASTAHASTAAPLAKGTVTVDFAESLGPRMQTERVNNLSRAHTFSEQREADVQFFNEQGLHGEIYRVWVDANLIHDPKILRRDMTTAVLRITSLMRAACRTRS